MIEPFLRILPLAQIFLPLVCFLVLVFSSLSPLKESAVRSMFGVLMGLGFVLALCTLYSFIFYHELHGEVSFFNWYSIGSNPFHFKVRVDSINVYFSLFFAVIIAVVGYFSGTYLHKDQGFHRFFIIFSVFALAIQLTIFSENLDTLFVGWELVGICSVLLIGFYHLRERPVVNSMVALITYRLCDIFLVLSVLFTHYYFGHTDFSIFSESETTTTGVILLLIVLASFGKSALLPFSSWLPRSMEGPTPSSAIFYGGLSVHLGPLLLLKVYPALVHYPSLQALLIVNGLLSSLFASIIGRIRSDIKTQLTYATLAQISLIYVEIGLGFITLAVVHCILHCLARTFQLLKAPSLIKDHHYFHITSDKFYAEKYFPKFFRIWLYKQAFSGFYLDTLCLKLFLRPLVSISVFFGRLESYLCFDDKEEVAIDSESEIFLTYHKKES